MPCGPNCADCARIQRSRELIEANRAATAELAKKARQILATILDVENRRRLERENRVIVTGSHGGRYAVTVGYSGNVFRLDPRGEPFRNYCAHPEMVVNGSVELPVEVAMIGQILALSSNEPEFLRIAI